MDLKDKYEVTPLKRAKEFQLALEKIKKDFIPIGCNSSKPLFIIAGGQPGSGKTLLVETIKMDYPNVNFLVIDLDAYRSYHPDFEEIKQNHKEDGVVLTNSFAFAIEDEIIAYAIKNSLNTINVSTLRNTDLEMKLIEKVTGSGFDTKVYVIAVPPEESYFSALKRYQEQQKDEKSITRYTSKKFHDISYENLGKTLELLTGLKIPIVVCKRANEKTKPAQVVYNEERNIKLVNELSPIHAINKVRKNVKQSALLMISKQSLDMSNESLEIQREYKSFKEEIDRVLSDKERD